MANINLTYNCSNLLLFIAILFIVSSCGKQTLYDHNEEVNEPWNSADKAEFEIDITDTINPYNVYLNIRNTVDYNYSNLYLFIKTEFPNKYVAIDTAEIFLADIKGNWLGKGFGEIKDIQVLFRKNGRFARKGIYHISFEQAMRDIDLYGIKSVGIRIERSN